MLQVICVKVGTKFRPEYVTHLQNGLRHHLDMPFDFACLTDDPTGLRCRTIPPLRDDLEGWWHKVTLFSSELAGQLVSNRVLYLDLDVVIRGDITPMIRHGSAFLTIKDLWQQGNPMNSTFMLWDHNLYHYVYDKFEGPGDFVGDQNYIDTCVGSPVFINEVWPEWVKSYKIELKHQPPADDERLVYFHGEPRPWDVEWVRELWNKQKQYD